MTGEAIKNNAINGKKQLAILIDPDKSDQNHLEQVLDNAIQYKADYFFVGGSLMTSDDMDTCLAFLKTQNEIPVVLFPGSPLQVNSKADAILLLSLISGRNAELLIGQHVIAAPLLKKSKLEILPTGYMLIDGGKQTTASYISNTFPLPADKPEIAATTAMAGEMLGLKYIYCDTGSGALHPVSSEIIQAVDQTVDIPIIVGGGINTPEKADKAYEAGANLIVVGNAFEKSPHLMEEMLSTRFA